MIIFVYLQSPTINNDLAKIIEITAHSTSTHLPDEPLLISSKCGLLSLFDAGFVKFMCNYYVDVTRGILKSNLSGILYATS